MDVHHGHETKKFDSTNQKELKDMIKFILEKINSGFILFGGVRGEEFKKLADRSTIRDEKAVKEMLLNNDSFMMQEEVKLLIAPVPFRG